MTFNIVDNIGLYFILIVKIATTVKFSTLIIYNKTYSSTATTANNYNYNTNTIFNYTLVY